MKIEKTAAEAEVSAVQEWRQNFTSRFKKTKSKRTKAKRLEWSMKSAKKDSHR